MNGKGYKIVIALLAAILVVMCVFVVSVLRRPVAVSVTPPSEPGSGLVIGYASKGVTFIDDAEALQEAVDEAYAESRRSGIGIRFENSAYSVNGSDFTCYIGNSDSNEYDMFIAIYADDAFEDLLFLSELIKPGQAFTDIRLAHPLESGKHIVNCVFTQVEEIDGEQSIHAQTALTLDFYVR